MSQERTEQRRDFAKDREIIGAATPGPWRRQKCLVAGRGAFAGQVIADCGGGFKPIDESNAIYVTESRTAWPAALDEIDRLNAVIGNYKSLSDQDAREIKRLTDLVDKQIEIINGHNDGMALAKYLHKKDQENIAAALAEIDRLSWSNGEQVKEIERLRASITAAIEKADWAESYDNEFPRLGYLDVKDILRAALKGVE